MKARVKEGGGTFRARFGLEATTTNGHTRIVVAELGVDGVLGLNRNEFVWIVSYDGPEDWEAKQKAYYGSPERHAVSPVTVAVIGVGAVQVPRLELGPGVGVHRRTDYGLYSSARYRERLGSSPTKLAAEQMT